MGRHQVSTTSERIAQKRAGSKRYLLPVPTAVEDTPLGEYLTKEWLPAIRTEIEPTTYSYLETTTRLYINPQLGEVAVSAIHRDMLRSFYGELLRTRSRNGGFLSKLTVIQVHSTLSWAFQTLVESRRLPSNPAWGIRPRLAKSERRRPVIWSPQQLLHFLEFVKTDDYYPLWNTLALTGMRRGEVLGLQWGDFSQDMRFVAIRRSWNLNGSTAYMTAPKGASARRINLMPQTIAVLKRHHRKQQTLRTKAGERALRAQDHVFTRADGELLRPTWLTKRFVKLGKDADLARIRLHDLRHTHASHLLEAGGNYKAVQERLGHADPVFTIDTYVHLMPTIQAEGVKSLAKFYGEIRKAVG
jgi:integrase